MWEAVLEDEEDRVDFEMSKEAWSTAHIMNSSGNYKKIVKPNKLYVSKADRDKKDSKQSTRPTIEQIDKEKDALKRLFNIKD